jgi:hypothetical protein
VMVDEEDRHIINGGFGVSVTKKRLKLFFCYDSLEAAALFPCAMKMESATHNHPGNCDLTNLF